MRVVTVNGYSAKWLRKGFPWVYPKEVVKGQPRKATGSWVELRDERGTRLGSGIADAGWIAVRVFEHDQPEHAGPAGRDARRDRAGARPVPHP